MLRYGGADQVGQLEVGIGKPSGRERAVRELDGGAALDGVHDLAHHEQQQAVHDEARDGRPT